MRRLFSALREPLVGNRFQSLQLRVHKSRRAEAVLRLLVTSIVFTVDSQWTVIKRFFKNILFISKIKILL